MMKVASDRLSVDIAAPGEAYQGSRYDWTGFVTQVTLDGRHTFCGVESPVPGVGSGGLGLCNEFGIVTPLGYEGTPPGQPFPKLGVGLLTRLDSEAYQFFRPYPVQPCHFAVWQDDAAIKIVADPLPCVGLAARLEKTMRVDGNALVIGYQLANTGTKPLITEEYAHNYLCLDTAPIGPDYALTLPAEATIHLLVDQQRRAEEGTPPLLSAQGPTLRLNYAPKDALLLDAAAGAPAETAPSGSWWQVTHRESGLGVRETTSFAWERFALYGTPHCLCPEAYLRLSLLPGQSQAWFRRYTFSADGSRS